MNLLNYLKTIKVPAGTYNVVHNKRKGFSFVLFLETEVVFIRGASDHTTWEANLDLNYCWNGDGKSMKGSGLLSSHIAQLPWTPK